MSNALSQGKISALATTLQDWLREKIGMQAPLPEEIEAVIREHFDKFGVTLVDESVSESKVAALLKPSLSESSTSKRMRELAGIPHKKNYT